MNKTKAREIIDLNIKEAGKIMPPDTLEALKIGSACITYALKVERYPHEIDNIPIPGETPEGDSP